MHYAELLQNSCGVLIKCTRRSSEFKLIVLSGFTHSVWKFTTIAPDSSAQFNICSQETLCELFQIICRVIHLKSSNFRTFFWSTTSDFSEKCNNAAFSYIRDFIWSISSTGHHQTSPKSAVATPALGLGWVKDRGLALTINHAVWTQQPALHEYWRDMSYWSLFMSWLACFAIVCTKRIHINR